MSQWSPDALSHRSYDLQIYLIWSDRKKENTCEKFHPPAFWHFILNPKQTYWLLNEVGWANRNTEWEGLILKKKSMGKILLFSTHSKLKKKCSCTTFVVKTQQLAIITQNDTALVSKILTVTQLFGVCYMGILNELCLDTSKNPYQLHVSPVIHLYTGRHNTRSGSFPLPRSPCKWSRSDPHDEYPGNRQTVGLKKKKKSSHAWIVVGL